MRAPAGMAKKMPTTVKTARSHDASAEVTPSISMSVGISGTTLNWFRNTHAVAQYMTKNIKPLFFTDLLPSTNRDVDSWGGSPSR